MPKHWPGFFFIGGQFTLTGYVTMFGARQKGIIWGVLAPFSLMSVMAPAAQAATAVTTAQAFSQSGISSPSAERDRVTAFLAREDVADQLVRLGVEPAAAQARVAALTDTEIAGIDQHLDQLPAGGNGVIGALVFIFVLLLITDILGFTKIFPFTRSLR